MSDKFSFLKDLDISYEAGRATYFYHPYAICTEFSSDADWQFRFGCIVDVKRNIMKVYVISKSPEDFSFFLKEELKGKKFLARCQRVIESTPKKLISSMKGVEVQKLSNKQLNTYLQEYFGLFSKILSTAWVMRALDRAIVEYLKGHVNEETFGKLSPLLSISEKKSFSVRKEEEMLMAAAKLSAEKHSPKELLKKAILIHSHFTHITLGYYNEPPEQLDSYIEQLKEFVASNPKRLLAQLNAKHEKEVKNKEKQIRELNLQKEVVKVIQIAGESAWLKDNYKFCVNRLIFEAGPLLEEAARRTNRTLDFVKDLLPAEVELLLQEKNLDEKLIAERKEQYILVTYKKPIAFLVGSDAGKFERKYLLDDWFLTQFKGRVACKGSALGKAKVVLGPRDFHKVLKGDIIVVMNTSPDFVPVLLKAGGIVSEEGGITAHVSVVSREMNIPCVVGIKHATNKISDGELIEVDAINGIVSRKAVKK